MTVVRRGGEPHAVGPGAGLRRRAPSLSPSRHLGASRPRASLRRQLLVVLVALSAPLLVVGAVSSLLLQSGTAGHRQSTARIQVAAKITDLQARVAGLSTSLTTRELLLGQSSALSAMLEDTSDVEAGFTALRPGLPPRERTRVDLAYAEWQRLLVVLSSLPSRLPLMLVDSAALSRSLSDIGPRILHVAQELNAAAADNAHSLQSDLDTAHRTQRGELAGLAGLALAGLLAAVLAARWLHRRITDPLVALRDAALRFGADDLDDRVVEDRTPELAALAAAFNQMADRLQDSRTLLTAREQRFRALAQNSSDLVAVVDAGSLVTYVTPEDHALFEAPASQLVGQRLLDRVHPEDRQLVAAVLDAAVLADDVGDTVSCRLDDGGPDPRHVELVVRNLTDEPAVGGLVVTLRDVTEQARLHEQLRHHAFHDELTGLANRVLFSDRLSHALTGRDQSPPAVLFCDLDDFKQVNDTLGHAAGDELLLVVAQRIAGVLRPRDTAARFGGDEFAVLLEGVDDQQALLTAERLRAAVAAPLVVKGVEIVPRISVGVSAGTAAGGAEELLRQADAAMYQAKHRGDDVVVFDADLADDLLARLELKADLQRALRDAEFELYYQPTVDLTSGLLTGVEALIRWHHPTRGLVSPVDFIPLAEETGLIVRLGLWVLETACLQVNAWQVSHPQRHLQLSVNLSGRQLEYADIVADVASVLAVTGLAPALLTLELTESVLLDRSEEVLQRLHALKALGLRLAIDDFGTGYSSLSYLQRLPVDVLKIDKSFVDALEQAGEPGTGDALAATIVSLARTLGLGSVAEGIESAAQAEALLQLGCDVGQGYLFARPLPAGQLTALLDRPCHAGRLVAL